MILTDNETKVDLLNNEAIAKTIINLLKERQGHPVTIGVHGDWGAGKSSVLEMIEAGFAKDGEVLCLKFNGWRFQGFEDAKIALIEGIVTGLIEKRPALTKGMDAVKKIFKRMDWLKVAKSAGGLAITANTGIPMPGQVEALIGTVKGFISDPDKLATKANFEGVLDSMKLLKGEDSESKNVPEEIGEFRKEFDELLSKAGIKQLVVLIDDLDRCLPDTAIETLEAIRLFVFAERTAFVVAADEAMIEYSVRKHFPDLPDTTGPRDYARNYLEKLIQIPFRIPALGETETRIYVTLLLVGAELGEQDPEYASLITAARALLKKPWESSGLDQASIKRVLGGKFGKKVQDALTLSDQIGPILANGSQGNPRQIKRFLNGLLLRYRSAEARGFSDSIKMPVLAKLMLAERFIPRLFDQIAAASAVHPQGLCSDIAVLEASRTKSVLGSSKGSGEGTKKDEGAADSENLVLTEWRASQPILSWCGVAPSLSGIDLRPYLFISKDRKDYFGSLSVLGHLGLVVDKLLGPKMSVQAQAADLMKLAPGEAGKVFDALKGRILGQSLDVEPSGVPGLVALVKSHPALQSNLLEFLESLPQESCGVWCVSGWEVAISDSGASARLNALLGRWASMPKNPVLKAAASAALALRTKKATRS